MWPIFLVPAEQSGVKFTNRIADLHFMGMQPPQNKPGIKISASPDGLRVLAELAPLEGREPPSLNEVKKEIDAAGFASAEIDEKILSSLQKRWKSEQQTFVVEIGRLKNATVVVNVSKNKLEAYLTIEKAKGGKAATLEDVLAAFKKEGVKFGVLPDAVKATVGAGEGTNVLIARGRPAVHGERAQFLPMVSNSADRRPAMHDDGSVDYRDVLNVPTVKAGTPLMRREPATKGVSGFDVKGRELAAKDGKDVPYASRLKNVTVSAEDKNVLVSAIAGQPVLEVDGMSVDPTITVDKVDISTGNLEFDGTAIVKGDVLTGMRVKVSGDVHIGGMVEASTIEAGGDIFVAGGVIGRGEIRTPDGKFNESAAVLRAEGSVSARFVENALVTAKKDIAVKDLVAHSELQAIGRVVVGGKGAPKGQIIGGMVEGQGGVEAINVGTMGGVLTRIRVGASLSPWKEKQRTIESKLEQNQVKLTQLQAVMMQLMQKPSPDEEVIKKAQATEALLDSDAVELNKQLQEVMQAIKHLSNAKVVAKQHLFGGVELVFLDKTRVIKEDQGPVQFQLENGTISKK